MGNDLPDYQSQWVSAAVEATSFRSGLDADKPASPAAGDIWLARDTYTMYVCMVAGAWVSLTPKGTIAMWHGLLSAIPTGWALCDGTLGTPNLVDKFVKGVATAATNPGTTGGEASHTLTTAELPAHTHTMPWEAVNAAAGGGAFGISSATGPASGSTGSGAAHENRPPYYEIAYIMKT